MAEVIQFYTENPFPVAVLVLSLIMGAMFMLNNRDTLRCRTIALEAIRDYNIDNYMLDGRENWERLKYERVMWPYTHTWFALKKDAKAVIRPEYLEELEKYYKFAEKFHKDV